MKDIEWQVTSLEISKRLRELGCKQESVWSYGKYLGFDGYGLDLTKNWNAVVEPFMISAYTVAELGKVITEHRTGLLPSPGFSPNDISWSIPICLKLEPTHPYAECFDTEANARGKMLIYLYENGLTGEVE